MTQPAPGAAPVPVLPPVLIVSGTGTEVGKTVVTAAVAALAGALGIPVLVPWSAGRAGTRQNRLPGRASDDDHHRPVGS